MADDRADLLDNSLDIAIGYEQAGNVRNAEVWAGCLSNGNTSAGNELGLVNVNYGDFSDATTSWLATANTGNAGAHSLYAVSPLLTVPGEASFQQW